MEEGKEFLLLLLLLTVSAWAPSTRGETKSLQETDASKAENDGGGFVSNFLNFLARSNPAMAANTISNTAPEKVPGVLNSFPPDIILSVTSRLNDTDRVRILGYLDGSEIMNLTGKMSSQQKGQLLGYLPADGVVSLSSKLSPKQLGHLLTSLQAESIVNLTDTLNEEQNYQIISRLSGEGVIGLIQMLNDSQAMQVLGHLPPSGILNITSTLKSSELATLIGSLAPDSIFQLVLSLPPQGVPNLILKLPPAALENLTMSLQPSQRSMLLTSLPPGAIVRITSALNTDELSTVLASLPAENLLNLTRVLPVKNVEDLLGSVSPEAIKDLIAKLDPTAQAALLETLPVPAVGNMLKELPPEVIADLVMSLPLNVTDHLVSVWPADIVVNVTRALNVTQMVYLVEHLSPGSVVSIASILPGAEVAVILHAVPVEALISLTSALNSSQLQSLLKVMPVSTQGDIVSKLPAEALAGLLSKIPLSVVANLVVSLPPADLMGTLGKLDKGIVANITMALDPVQLSKLMMSLSMTELLTLVSKLPPGIPGQLLASLPAQNLLNITKSLPPDYVGVIFSLLKPADIANVLNNIPANAIPDLLEVLPAQVLANLPMNLTVQLLGTFSNDTIVSVADKLSVEQLLAILANLPETIINDVLTKLPPESVLRLLNTASDDELSSLLTLIPETYVTKLIASLDPEVILNLTLSLSPKNLAHILLSVDPAQAGKLIGYVPKHVVMGLIFQLPPELLVNLTTVLPVDKLAEILVSLNSTMTSKLLASLPKPALSGLIARLQQQPQALINLTMSLPQDALVTILTSLPDSQIKSLIQSFPQEAVNSLIPRIPVDLVLNLSRIIPASVLTGLPISTALNVLIQIPQDKLLQLINTFLPTGPMSLLTLIPKEILTQMLSSITPEQIKTLLGDIPPEKLESIVKGLLPDLLKMATEGGSLDLSKLLGPALDSVVKLVQGLDAQQLSQLVSQFQGVLQSSLPALQQALGNMTSSLGGESGLEQLLPGLASSLVSAVPVSSLLKVAEQMLPEIPRMLATSLGQLGAAMMAQSGQGKGEEEGGLQECLLDLQLYLLDLANGSDWAVKMFDASGKPSRGILKGNLHMQGSYDMCIDINHWAKNSLSSGGSAPLRHIQGSYCGGEISLPPGVLPPVPGQGILPDVTVELYLCLPNSCKAEDLTRFLWAVSLPMSITVPEVVCQKSDVLARDGAAIAAICVLCLFGILIFTGTALDVAKHCSSNSSSSGSGNFYSEDTHNFDLPHPSPHQPPHSPHSHANGGLNLQEKGLEGGKTIDVGGGEKQTSFIASKQGGGGSGGGGGGGGSSGGRPSGDHVSVGGGDGAMGLKVEVVGGRTDREEEEEEEEHRGSAIRNVLLAFSLPRNTKRILGAGDVRDSVTCLHGIRVLSIFWLIVGNSVLYMAPEFENSLGAAEVLETLLGQVVIHATLAVDAFFLISGCLTVVTFLRKVRMDGGVGVKTMITYFIRRYIRLTPTYAVTIMALSCLLPYVSEGPSWTQQSRRYYRPCHSHWWTNLLYISNFHPALQQQCVPWGWYLATDLQFHWLVAPFILILFAMGFKIVGSLLIGSLVIMQGVLTYYFENDINGDFLRNGAEYRWKVFEKPYTRMAPFVLGLGVGYILIKVKGRLNIHKMAVLGGWLAAIGVILATVLVKYDDNHVMLEEPFHWSAAARAWHEVLYRICFSLGLCWVVLMCATGNGGFINSMLSWRVFVPVSRLVFCIYLLHPAVILADVWQTRVPPYFTVSFVLQKASGYILISAIFAFFLSVTVETPVNALQKFLLKKPGHRRSHAFSTAL